MYISMSPFPLLIWQTLLKVQLVDDHVTHFRQYMLVSEIDGIYKNESIDKYMFEHFDFRVKQCSFKSMKHISNKQGNPSMS